MGVYADLKHLGPQAETRPEVMFPYAQMHDYWVTRFMRGLSVVMRTTGDPTSLVPPRAAPFERLTRRCRSSSRNE